LAALKPCYARSQSLAEPGSREFLQLARYFSVWMCRWKSRGWWWRRSGFEKRCRRTRARHQTGCRLGQDASSRQKSSCGRCITALAERGRQGSGSGMFKRIVFGRKVQVRDGLGELSGSCVGTAERSPGRGKMRARLRCGQRWRSPGSWPDQQEVIGLLFNSGRQHFPTHPGRLPERTGYLKRKKAAAWGVQGGTYNILPSILPSG
jgi:hypothetical protein